MNVRHIFLVSDSCSPPLSGSGFDFLFVMKRLYELGIYTTFLSKGNKILGLRIPQFSIRFVDFFLYVGHSLRTIKTSMGLSCDSKGYFPFLLNTGKNMEARTKIANMTLIVLFRIQLPPQTSTFARRQMVSTGDDVQGRVCRLLHLVL